LALPNLNPLRSPHHLLLKWKLLYIDSYPEIKYRSTLLTAEWKNPQIHHPPIQIQIQTPIVWLEKRTKMNPPPESPDQQRRPVSFYSRLNFTSLVRRTSFKDDTAHIVWTCLSYEEDLDESGQANILTNSLPP